VGPKKAGDVIDERDTGLSVETIPSVVDVKVPLVISAVFSDAVISDPKLGIPSIQA
jgi:hypothetical protein